MFYFFFNESYTVFKFFENLEKDKRTKKKMK